LAAQPPLIFIFRTVRPPLKMVVYCNASYVLQPPPPSLELPDGCNWCRRARAGAGGAGTEAGGAGALVVSTFITNFPMLYRGACKKGTF